MLRMFYFSGTGNARNVAHWMVEAWTERDRRAEAVDLSKFDVGALRIQPDDEVGVVSPTHGFNFPPITLSFLLAFPRTTFKNPVYVFNTRAGVRLFGVYLPGLSGVAQILAALVFLAKGYSVRAMRGIDLPSNWISLHPGPKEDLVRSIYERTEVIARRSVQRLLAGRRDLRALFDLPQDVLLVPISIGYYLVGRFLFAKSFVASSACDACGLCVRQCPVKAVLLVDGRPYWSHRCESCMRCMNGCPRRAIETAHGIVIGFMLALDVVMVALVYPAVAPYVPLLVGAGAVAGLVRFVFETIVMLAALFLSYRIVHLGMRFRVVERLVILTSLTHYGFWRRYRAPRFPRADRSPEAD